MTEKNLSAEVTRLLEAGFVKYLNQSIIYSPLRLFYNLFRKNNPQAMNNIREVIRSDVEKCLNDIDNFNQKVFVTKSGWTMDGKNFLRACYNVGINILRKKLSVITAFKILKNHKMRDKIYNYILAEVRSAAIKVSNDFLERNKT